MKCKYCLTRDEKHWHFCKYIQQHDDWFIIFNPTASLWLIFPNYFQQPTKTYRLFDWNGQFFHTSTSYVTAAPFTLYDHYVNRRAREIQPDTLEFEECLQWMKSGI